MAAAHWRRGKRRTYACSAALPSGAGTGLEPSLGHDRRGSLQWLPARVMFDLPQWHTQRCGGCRKTPATSTARHGPYLLVRLRVRPERHRAQSCTIALRSDKILSYLSSGDPLHGIHQIFTSALCAGSGIGGRPARQTSQYLRSTSAGNNSWDVRPRVPCLRGGCPPRRPI